MTKDDLQRIVSEELRVQKDEEAAGAITDGRERALQLKTFASSPCWPARNQAIQELGRGGPAAVPTISQMLDDPNYFDRGPELLRALVAAGGKTVGEELTRRLQRELAFWSSVGPSLKAGWWNQDVTPTSPLRNRYSLTVSLIYELTQVSYQGAWSNGVALRSLWLTLPPLAPGDQQMLEACDELIAELKPK